MIKICEHFNCLDLRIQFVFQTPSTIIPMSSTEENAESAYVDDTNSIKTMTEDGGHGMHKAVSIIQLVCISFFFVCAGPFGQGEVMYAGGPKFTFIFTLVVPIVFSVPVALISSEQASRLPMCGGCCEWGLILGRFMGMVNTFTRTLCSIFDNAIYPVMLCDYLSELIPELEDNIGYRTIVVLLANIFVVGINVAGLEIVGGVSIFLTIFIIIPFLLFFFFGITKLDGSKIFGDKPESAGEVDLGGMLATLIWQYSGFDTIAALAEETKNPKRTFPVALSISLVLVILVYILPTISGASVCDDYELWEAGAFSEISKLLPHCSNGWLSIWISIAGCVSALSLLNIAISCTGRETYAGAILDCFPLSHYLGKLHKNMKGEPLPVVALIFMSVITIPFSFFDFEFLVEWSGILTVLQQLIQVAAFIALRFPSMVRRLKREQAILHARVEQVELSAIDASAQVSKAEQASLHEEAMNGTRELPEDDAEAEEDLSNKFIIPGGWVGVACVCVPLVGISIFLFTQEGWESLVISIAMIIALFILKGIEIGIIKLIVFCKRKRARARRDNRSEIEQSTAQDQSQL